MKGKQLLHCAAHQSLQVECNDCALLWEGLDPQGLQCSLIVFLLLNWWVMVRINWLQMGGNLLGPLGSKGYAQHHEVHLWCFLGFSISLWDGTDTKQFMWCQTGGSGPWAREQSCSLEPSANQSVKLTGIWVSTKAHAVLHLEINLMQHNSMDLGLSV